MSDGRFFDPAKGPILVKNPSEYKNACRQVCNIFFDHFDNPVLSSLCTQRHAGSCLAFVFNQYMSPNGAHTNEDSH